MIKINIIISNSDKRPIYEQVYAQIKSAIITGEINEGEILPSIRALASDLRISVITTKRAYEDLERDGFIETRIGKGCYVKAQNFEIIREENLKEIEKHLFSVSEKAKETNISYEELCKILKLLMED